MLTFGTVNRSSEKEIEKNSEIQDRFEVAKVLKEDAFWYIEQALRVFEDWCMENPGNGKFSLVDEALSFGPLSYLRKQVLCTPRK
jgi:hypothetical protein